MTRFIQLHLLTAYGAANLNRDDTGRPKTLIFGGAERLRVSSQSLKRAFRQSDVFLNGLPGALGKRSQGFMQGLIDALIAGGLAPEEARRRAEAVIENGKLGKVKDKGNGSAKIEQLVHLGPDEIATIGGLAERLGGVHGPDEKVVSVLKDKPRAADIAMFGRMLADNAGYNIEAAVQVAHAFTTHRVIVEEDYYTAIDDIKNNDRNADRGAGFIGMQQYGAGLFYLYVCVNADLLLANLSGDRALAANAVEALIEATATVSPSGKQNTFASRAKALYVLQEIGADSPRTLAAAFQKPVGTSQGETSYEEASIARLIRLRDGYRRAYNEEFDDLQMHVGQDGASLADLIAAARALYEG